MTDEKDKLRGVLARLVRDRHDQKAWMDLYDALWPRVFSIAYRLLKGRRELAEDTSQESFLRILRYVDFTKLNSVDDFLPYVHRIVLNAGKDILASANENELLFDTETRDFICGLLRDDNVEKNVIDSQSLLLAWEHLSPSEQTLVELLAQGATSREIATAMELTVTNVGVRPHRLRQRLRNIMKNEDNSTRLLLRENL